jgi:hypothetical protein
LSIRDPDIERAVKASSSFDVPAPPVPPPEITKSGKPLTKKEKKAVSCFIVQCGYLYKSPDAAQKLNRWF